MLLTKCLASISSTGWFHTLYRVFDFILLCGEMSWFYEGQQLIIEIDSMFLELCHG